MLSEQYAPSLPVKLGTEPYEYGASESNGPSGGQIMLIAKRLKNYTGYVTTKSRDRGVATSPPRISIICNTVQYEYDYQLGNQYERLRYEYSYDCFFVRFRFTQCNKKYGTRQDPCLQATTPCDRQTNKQTHTRDVKSGGCTDNAERTTQDNLRKKHEIGQSPPAHPKA